MRNTKPKPKTKPKPSYPSPYDSVHVRKLRNHDNHERSTEIRNGAYVGQLVVIVIGESRAFAGEVAEVDPETGQILAAYITGGRMLRYQLGKPPTCALLPHDWTDKQTVFSLCPREGWETLMRARDVLEPLYREWLEAEKQKADQRRKEWLAKYSIAIPAKPKRKETK